MTVDNSMEPLECMVAGLVDQQAGSRCLRVTIISTSDECYDRILTEIRDHVLIHLSCQQYRSTLLTGQLNFYMMHACVFLMS